MSVGRRVPPDADDPRMQMSRPMDGVLLAVGTLTRIPVRPPTAVDRRTAGTAMSIAPLVGLLLAALIGLPMSVLSWALDAPGRPLASMLVSILAVAALAWITRGLHLDGLADLADALGSNRPPQQALVIARQPDIGPFGTMALVLVLVIQAVALGVAIDAGTGTTALATALVASRLALTWACIPHWPAARGDGLGAMVAQSTKVAVAGGITAVLVLIGGMSGWLLAGNACGAMVVPAAVGSSLLAGWAVLRLANRRLGGITGDVLGACVEVAFAAGLVATAAMGSFEQAHLAG